MDKFKDAQLEEYIQGLAEEYFYIVNDGEEDNLKGYTDRALHFRIELGDISDFRITCDKQVLCWSNIDFFQPGINGLLAFFYAIDQGYSTVWMEEYDYPEAFFRMKAINSKNSECFILQLSNFIYNHEPNEYKILVNKGKTLGNFKRVMQKAFSDDVTLYKIGYECFGRDFKYEKPISDNDIELLRELKKMLRRWNFVRSSCWLFEQPLKKIETRWFVSDYFLKKCSEYRRQQFIEKKLARDPLRMYKEKMKDIFGY